MPRVYIAPDEWWPVLTMTSLPYGDGYVAEFTDEEIADLLRVQNEFNAWQEAIGRRIGHEPDTFTLVPAAAVPKVE